MEEGAHMSFKVPPPGIEFTLPSPKIGIESLPVVDPPWCPRQQTKDMEVTLNQERHVIKNFNVLFKIYKISLIVKLAYFGYCHENTKETTN